MSADQERVELELEGEERQERQADRRYWEPLRRELEQIRRERHESD